MSPNCLYDVLNEMKIEMNLYRGKEKVDIAQFLDDVSVWMDTNRDKITEEYLPFCVLSVGVVPVQVSAFMYGLCVGKAVSKHKLSLDIKAVHVDKDVIMKEIEKNMNIYDGLLGGKITEKPKEKDDDDGFQKSGK